MAFSKKCWWGKKITNLNNGKIIYKALQLQDFTTQQNSRISTGGNSCQLSRKETLDIYSTLILKHSWNTDFIIFYQSTWEIGQQRMKHLMWTIPNNCPFLFSFLFVNMGQELVMTLIMISGEKYNFENKIKMTNLTNLTGSKTNLKSKQHL